MYFFTDDRFVEFIVKIRHDKDETLCTLVRATVWRADRLRKISVAGEPGISRRLAVTSDTIEPGESTTNHDVPIISTSSRRCHARLYSTTALRKSRVARGRL